jgi:hypothetical protein
MNAVKKNLLEKSPDQVEAFEKGAKAYVPKLLGRFKDLEFVSKRSSLSQCISFRLLVYWGERESRGHGCLARLSRRRHTLFHVSRRNMKARTFTELSWQFLDTWSDRNQIVNLLYVEEIRSSFLAMSSMNLRALIINPKGNSALKKS